jgi:hypothetical protein
LLLQKSSGAQGQQELESIHLDDAPVEGTLPVLLVGDEQRSYTTYLSLHTLELEDINLGRGFLEKVLILRAGYGVGVHTLRPANCRNLMGDAMLWSGFK